eukprot:838967-Rhodomonas_salina.1
MPRRRLPQYAKIKYKYQQTPHSLDQERGCFRVRWSLRDTRRHASRCEKTRRGSAIRGEEAGYAARCRLSSVGCRVGCRV